MDWLEIIRTLAPVVTAVIAFLALRNWQRQDKAKREAEFLDALIEEMHAYILAIRIPLGQLKLSQTGIRAHASTSESGDESEKTIKGAVTYIEKNGERDAQRLFEKLNDVRPSLGKLRALVAKGQVFRFKDYAVCREDLYQLMSQFEKLESCGAVLGLTGMNWEHPIVIAQLKTLVALDAEAIHADILKYNLTVIKFATDTYKRIYG